MTGRTKSGGAIWTIGYEAAGFAPFAEALRQAGIELVLDVRDLPLSRRAGFSKNVLAASLAERGIGYAHLKGLGTPKEGRLAARRGDYVRFWAIFEAKMASPEAEFDLQRAAELAREHRCALLCFEADPAKCHRRHLSDALAERYGFEVVDLRVQPLL